MKFQMSNKKTSDHHATPQKVFDYVHEELGIDLKEFFDPCPLNADFDGLAIRWQDKNYVNPPYSKIEDFINKSYFEYLLGNDCYILFPLSKSDKKYFQNVSIRFQLLFFPFRIKFVGSKNPSPQTHCLVIMK